MVYPFPGFDLVDTKDNPLFANQTDDQSTNYYWCAPSTLEHRIYHISISTFPFIEDIGLIEDHFFQMFQWRKYPLYEASRFRFTSLNEAIMGLCKIQDWSKKTKRRSPTADTVASLFKEEILEKIIKLVQKTYPTKSEDSILEEFIGANGRDNATQNLLFETTIEKINVEKSKIVSTNWRAAKTAFCALKIFSACYLVWENIKISYYAQKLITHLTDYKNSSLKVIYGNIGFHEMTRYSFDG